MSIFKKFPIKFCARHLLPIVHKLFSLEDNFIPVITINHSRIRLSTSDLLSSDSFVDDCYIDDDVLTDESSSTLNKELTSGTIAELLEELSSDDEVESNWEEQLELEWDDSLIDTPLSTAW